jgi:hypothetical protein
MRERRFWQGERGEKQRKRYLFFEEITESAYHINASLRNDIYIPFQAVIPGYYTPRFEALETYSIEYFKKTHPDSKWGDHEHFDTWEAYLAADADHYPELIPVRDAVINWSRENNLDADWCREVIVDTLNDWVREDSRGKDDYEFDWQCSPGGRVGVHPYENKIVPLPGFPRYFPFTHRSVDHYLREVRKWMEAKIIPESVWHKLRSSWIGSDVGTTLDKYIEEDLDRICEIAKFYALSLENYYKKEGYGTVRTYPEESKHIRWAVQAQINKETTFSSIATSEGLLSGGKPNVSYVRREVLKVLGEIELPPRPGLLGSGRRRGATEKTPRRRVSSQ